MKKAIILVVMAIILAACGADDTAGTPSTTTTPEPTSTTILDPESDGAVKVEGPAAKLSSHLASAASMAAEGADTDEIAARNPELQFDGDAILVEVTVADSIEDVAGVAEAAGLQVSGEFDEFLMITGSISALDLLDLAGLDGVVTVVPAFGATTN